MQKTNKNVIIKHIFIVPIVIVLSPIIISSHIIYQTIRLKDHIKSTIKNSQKL